MVKCESSDDGEQNRNSYFFEKTDYFENTEKDTLRIEKPYLFDVWY